jgi:hypothetical protein
MDETLNDEAVERTISRWPRAPQASARRLIEAYGPPDEHSPSTLTWYRTPDGWKRTVLTRHQVPHDFPLHHTDFLEQFIDYRVPLEMYSALAEFDGSVMVERTRGELSARCAGTSMNFAAVNLANDIVCGRRTVAEAREEYVRLYQAVQRGEHPSYAEAFLFRLSRVDTRDPDVSLL